MGLKTTFHKYILLCISITCLTCLCGLTRAFALEPEEVLVVINTKFAGAAKLAKYYMQKRNIPENHLLRTSLTLEEVMDRAEYEDDLVAPLRKKLEQLKDTRIYAVVLVYGVPLKVRPPLLDWDVQEELRDLKFEKQSLKEREGEEKGVSADLKELNRKINEVSGSNKQASVDSELALAKVEEYELGGWIENPYFIGFQGRRDLLKKDDVLLVSRLDGPDLDTVYRIINDTLSTEAIGLKGKGYFDARWQLPEKKKLSGYALYDASIHKAAQAVEKRMEIELDVKPQLFPPESAPNAALYCGWYSLGKYIDSFEWVKGAVAFHIASNECTTLKKSESNIWCMQMLKRGVAATVGPVHEPYVTGFPLPELFFSYLTEGYMTLGESYLVSLPFLSWQMVLVGDPLYKPFPPL